MCISLNITDQENWHHTYCCPPIFLLFLANTISGEMKMYFYECIKLIIFPLFLSFPISGGRYKCTFTNASPACKLDLLTDPAGAKTVPYSLLFVPHISFGKYATKYYIRVFFKCSRPASFSIIFQFFSQAFPSSCPLLAASASDHQKSELKSNLPGIFSTAKRCS